MTFGTCDRLGETFIWSGSVCFLPKHSHVLPLPGADEPEKYSWKYFYSMVSDKRGRTLTNLSHSCTSFFILFENFTNLRLCQRRPLGRGLTIAQSCPCPSPSSRVVIFIPRMSAIYLVSLQHGGEIVFMPAKMARQGVISDAALSISRHLSRWPLPPRPGSIQFDGSPSYVSFSLVLFLNGRYVHFGPLTARTRFSPALNTGEPNRTDASQCHNGRQPTARHSSYRYSNAAAPTPRCSTTFGFVRFNMWHLYAVRPTTDSVPRPTGRK